MFQISVDQTQWVHLYRVLKVYPTTFVLFTCEEVHDQGNVYRILDLRILPDEQNSMGGSWCVKSHGKDGKASTRADCAKFLELHAKFAISNATRRGIDEIELVESSRDELSMAAVLDEKFRVNLEAVAPTLYPKMARNLIKEISLSQTGLDYDVLTDWPDRNPDAAQ